MAIAIAEVAATGADLRSVDAQDRIVARWVGWSRTAADVGNQTSQVLGRVLDGGVLRRGRRRAGGVGRPARANRAHGGQRLADADRAGRPRLPRRPGRAGRGGDGRAARSRTSIRSAGEACVLWCLAIRHAVLTGALNPRAGLGYVPAEQPGRLGRAAGRRRATAAERLQQQRLGRRGAAGRVVARSSARRIRFPAEDPKVGVSRYRSAADVARDRGTGRPRRGHGGRDRRRPRRRGLRRVRRSRCTGGQRSTAGPATTPPT